MLGGVFLRSQWISERTKSMRSRREDSARLPAPFVQIRTCSLTVLATLGLTAAEFSHETGMAFQAVRLDLNSVFEAALAARGSDNTFVETAHRAR